MTQISNRLTPQILSNYGISGTNNAQIRGNGAAQGTSPGTNTNISGTPASLTISGTTWNIWTGADPAPSGIILGHFDGGAYAEELAYGKKGNPGLLQSGSKPSTVTFNGQNRQTTWILSSGISNMVDEPTIEINAGTYVEANTPIYPNPTPSKRPSLNTALAILQNAENTWSRESGGKGVGSIDGLDNIIKKAANGTLTIAQDDNIQSIGSSGSGHTMQDLVNAAQTVLADATQNAASGSGDYANWQRFNSLNSDGSSPSGTWKLDGTKSDDAIQQYFEGIVPLSFKGDPPKIVVIPQEIRSPRPEQTLLIPANGANRVPAPNTLPADLAALTGNGFEIVGGQGPSGGPPSSKWINTNELETFISAHPSATLMRAAKSDLWVMNNYNGAGHGINQMNQQDLIDIVSGISVSGSEGFQEGVGGAFEGDCSYLSVLNAVSTTHEGASLLASSITTNGSGPNTTDTVDFPGDPNHPITVTQSGIANNGHPFEVGNATMNIILAALNKDTSFLSKYNINSNLEIVTGGLDGLTGAGAVALFQLLTGIYGTNPIGVGNAANGITDSSSGIKQFLTNAASHVGKDMAICLGGYSDGMHSTVSFGGSGLKSNHCVAVTNINLSGPDGGTITYENPFNNTEDSETIPINQVTSGVANWPADHDEIMAISLTP